MSLGAYLGAAFPNAQSLEAIRNAGDVVFVGFGSLVLLLSLLGLIGVCAINLYTGTLTLMSMADSLVALKRTPVVRVGVMIAATIGVVLVAFGSSEDFLSNFHNFLLLLLYTMIPWTAVNLVDYYVVRRGQYNVLALTDDTGVYGRWNANGLAAYTLGFICTIPFFSVPGMYVGPIAKSLGDADISLFVGLPVAAITYLVLSRNTDVQAELAAVNLR